MPQVEPSLFNQFQLSKPRCESCGGTTRLTCIEPGPDAGVDLRTFACLQCAAARTVAVVFRVARQTS
jgi:hypothetical protein